MNKESLTSEELRATQLVQLDMLIEVDRICRKYAINYSLAGGTLLGAVRHKGYIPWDDDADIVMLRSEYIKFASIFNKNADETKYYFQDSDNTIGYRWGYGKVRRKGSLWVRKGQEHLPFNQEISIDIFPLDKMPSGRLRETIHHLHCFIIQKILWSEVGRYTSDTVLARFIYSLISRIPLQRVLRHYRRFEEYHNSRDNVLLRVLTFPTPKGFTYEGRIEWYSQYLEMEFEGHSFKIMQNYDEYLKLKYGDYMTLPPENERNNPDHAFSRFMLPKGEEK